MRCPRSALSLLASLLALLAGAACSQRVTPEDEYEGSDRPLLPASAVLGEAPIGAPDGDAVTVHLSWGAGTPPDVRPEESPGAPGPVLFVFLRPPGEESGPPLAVRRVPQPELPLSLSIGPADAMIAGTRFPERVVVHARLDADGDAATSGAGDWIAASEPVAPGGEARLVLGRAQGP